MKIFLNTSNESWIVDRFVEEFIKFNPQLITKKVEDADIVWVISPWTWRNISKKLLKKKKVICTIHHIDFDKFTGKESREFYKLDKFVDFYHAISKNTAEQLRTLTSKEITTLPFWIDENIWYEISDKNSLRKKFNINQNSFCIGSFQRDTEGKGKNQPKLSKGPDQFLKIVKELNLEKPVSVILTGYRRSYLIKELQKENINFYYFEKVSQTQINELYNCLDLYIVSSRVEGGPQAILECAITKTPIISTDVGVAAEILSKESIFNMENFGYAKPNTSYAYEKVKPYVVPSGLTGYIEMFKSNMKVAIGTEIREGPWGGGNAFANVLKNFLINEGHEVTTNLFDDDIDIVLITDPRKSAETSSFDKSEVKKYIKYINSECVVFHRINECDERKGTNYINKFYIEANKVADVTIFVSNWLRLLYEKNGLKRENTYVIKAGADKKIFNRSNIKKYKNEETLKLVTHHWGTNPNKGFSVYQKIDQILDKYNEKPFFTFKFIGNLPKNVNFKNIEVLEPVKHNEIGEILKNHHLYITASLFEPSGNHHVEAMQCGLPVLYINSGGTTEYCKDFGIEYNEANLEEKIRYAKENYDLYFNKLIDHQYDSETMCKNYLELFTECAKNKKLYIKSSSGNIYLSKFYKVILRIRKFIYENFK